MEHDSQCSEKCENSDELQAQLQKPQKELGFYHIVEDRRLESRWRDGGVENNERKTLPERPQRSHWKFNYKYTSTVYKTLH